MIRLDSIKIKGFKDPEAEKELVFSTEPISVIYGENGSGKTTMLKILYAILSRDERTLSKENVMKVELNYREENKVKQLIVERRQEVNLEMGFLNIQRLKSEDLFKWKGKHIKYQSILFGTHRGIVQSNKKDNAKFTVPIERPKNVLGIWEKQPNLFLDMIQMEDIETALINQYQKGQDAVSQKIKNAFLETIEKALEIDEQSDKDFSLPDDFEAKIEKHKNFILNAIKTTKENSTLTKRIENYLATKDKSLTDKSKIFRAMLLEMVESAEEPNPTLESITALMSIFNDHLYHQKKLVIEEESAFIDLGNGKKHDLADLSSGERNLLTILTLFLIVGNNRNFLLIDEPEISFNIKWQRRFLPLLSKINTQAQIIVASHSPSIAHQNSQYLVQLL